MAIIRAVLLMFCFLALQVTNSTATPTQPGTYFINSNIKYQLSGYQQDEINLNHPFNVVAAEKKSKISFKTYSPFGNSTGNILNGTDISVSGTKQGPFIEASLKPLEKLGINLKTPIPLVDTSVVRDGQVVFVHLQDFQRNRDPNIIDNVVVSLSIIDAGLTAQLGGGSVLDPNIVDLDNAKVIRLYETDPNSGIFMGYIIFNAVATSNLTSPQPELVINQNKLIAVSYQENNTGISEQDFVNFDATVSAEGRVFNSQTGLLLNNLNIILIDAVNSLPAQVFDTDGITPFPSTFVTGQDTPYSNNQILDVDDGEYIFPYVRPGKYRLRIDNLDNSSTFPSIVTQSDILNLPIDTPVIEAGSRGEVFDVTVPRSIGIDLPIDTTSPVTLQKRANKKSAAPGDLLIYELSVNNFSTGTYTNLTIVDNIPQEMRYQTGSLTINDIASNDALIDPNTGQMTINLPNINSAERLIIKYATRILPKVQDGKILRNTAQVHHIGGPVSNTAFEDVKIVDDMLQSKGTIVGRVYFDDCLSSSKDGNGNPDIIGLPNIRLFDQKGNFVITDEKGRFSFSGVDIGTNIIQLDKITLPKGISVSLCKNNTRTAGSAFSQFVDVSGGYVYKVNFTLNGDKELFRPPELDLVDPEKVDRSSLSQQELSDLLSQRPETSPAFKYDAKWLDTQNEKFEIVYPGRDFHPGVKSLSFGYKYPSKMKPKAYVNDRLVSQLHKVGVDANKDDTVRITHYSGVELQDSLNTLRVDLYDENNKFIESLTYQIGLNQKIYRIIPNKEKTKLIADGLRSPEIVLNLKDETGSPIGQGHIVQVQISEPYGLQRNNKDISDLTALNRLNVANAFENIPVSENGELIIKLQPTLLSGRLTLKIRTTEGNFEEYDFWMQSEKREWVLVGLAQGSLAHKTISGNMQNAVDEKIDADLSNTGKLQFYTKGTIDKKWLVTAKFDSQQRRSTERDELFGQIDINDRYTVVGDYSQQGTDAASQYPLYLKIEKDDFYALFGDYHTDTGTSRLLPYNRALSGFKTAYQGDNFSVQFFAAEDGQQYVRDDIPLLGIYQRIKLSGFNIVQNSEKAYIEIRDISDTTKVLSVVPVRQFLDYNIDYQDGVIVFNPSFQLDYNPILHLPILVAEFETYGDTETSKTFGSRFATKFLEGDIKIGVNLINEGSSIRTQGKASRGGSIDADIRLTDNTTLYAEYALTEGERAATVNDFGLLGNQFGAGDSQGTGKMLELIHKGDQLFARAYYQTQENGFGLGQASSFNIARESYGVEAVYNLTDPEISREGNDGEDILSDLQRGVSLYFKGNENKDTAGRGSIQLSEIGAKKEGNDYKVFSGLRHIREDVQFAFATNNQRQNFTSNSSLSQIISGGEKQFLDGMVTAFGGNEMPINDSKTTNSLYGNKSYLGFQTPIIPLTNTTFSHEWIDLNDEEFQNSALNVVVTPFTGLSLAVNGTNHVLPDDNLSSILTSANQGIKITEDVQLNLMYSHKEAIGGREGIFSTIDDIPDYYLPFFMRDVSVRTPINSTSVGYWEDYDVFGTGLSYKGKGWRNSNNIEYKTSETENRLNFSTSLIGEVTDSFTAGIRGNYQKSSFKNGITIDDYVNQLNDYSRNIGRNLFEFTDQNTLNFLKDSEVAQIIGGTSYRPNGEEGPILLHRTLLESNSNIQDDSMFKLVNNFALQANVTDKVELNAQYAHKFIQDKFNGQKYDDFINIVGNEWRYDIYEDFDVAVQGAAYHSNTTETLDYSYGGGVGYIPYKNIRVRAGYNITGFRDRDFSAFGYTAQGPYLSFDMKFDQEDVKDKLDQFMLGVPN